MSSPDPKAFLLDLDGTLYQGDAALPGAVAAIAQLRQRGTPFRCVTNTSSRCRALLVERLARYGFDVAEDEIFSATRAAAAMATARGHQIVAPFLPAAALADLAPLTLTGGSHGSQNGRPDAVVVGDLGSEWSHGLMQEAFACIMNGAELIACSRDRYWQRGDETVLDCGAFVAGLEYATGREALIAGKPSADFFRGALRSLGNPPAEDVAMIGDDLWSDVEGAQRAGLRGWLVRTGKFRADALAASGIVPDRILSGLATLTG
jgi:HAD superfamily hydrolase (TIGR01458 family)